MEPLGCWSQDHPHPRLDPLEAIMARTPRWREPVLKLNAYHPTESSASSELGSLIIPIVSVGKRRLRGEV